jgi:hypothetical protein
MGGAGGRFPCRRLENSACEANKQRNIRRQGFQKTGRTKGDVHPELARSARARPVSALPFPWRRVRAPVEMTTPGSRARCPRDDTAHGTEPNEDVPCSTGAPHRLWRGGRGWWVSHSALGDLGTLLRGARGSRCERTHATDEVCSARPRAQVAGRRGGGGGRRRDGKTARDMRLVVLCATLGGPLDSSALGHPFSTAAAWRGDRTHTFRSSGGYAARTKHRRALWGGLATTTSTAVRPRRRLDGDGRGREHGLNVVGEGTRPSATTHTARAGLGALFLSGGRATEGCLTSSPNAPLRSILARSHDRSIATTRLGDADGIPRNGMQHLSTDDVARRARRATDTLVH